MTPKYSAFQIHAVKSDGFMPDGKEFMTRCEDNDPDRVCFGLYGLGSGRMTEWISDHPTRADALQASKALQP